MDFHKTAYQPGAQPTKDGGRNHVWEGSHPGSCCWGGGWSTSRESSSHIPASLAASKEVHAVLARQDRCNQVTPSWRGLNNRNVLSRGPGGQKPEIKGSVGLVPAEGGPVPGSFSALAGC